MDVFAIRILVSRVFPVLILNPTLVWMYSVVPPSSPACVAVVATSRSSNVRVRVHSVMPKDFSTESKAFLKSSAKVR